MLDLKLCVLVVGTLVSFVMFGVAQEALTKTKYGDEAEKFTYTTFLVVLQSVGNALVAGLLLLVTYGSKTSFSAQVPLKEWLIVAIAYLGAHKFGLWSLLYIPFPLQVMVKSCKTIPVMAGEIVLAGSRRALQPAPDARAARW
jgi:UDP-galactose transporter B1